MGRAAEIVAPSSSIILGQGVAVARMGKPFVSGGTQQPVGIWQFAVAHWPYAVTGLFISIVHPRSFRIRRTLEASDQVSGAVFTGLRQFCLPGRGVFARYCYAAISFGMRIRL
jgi:hypothetical protein